MGRNPPYQHGKMMNLLGHWETRYSKRGYPIQVWAREMPRLDDQYLKSVVYLYPSEAAAEDGEATGGTGFFIGVPVSNPGNVIVTTLLCVMTNRHVVEQGNTTVRANTKDGKTNIFFLDDRNWIFHPGGDDLAVCPVGLAPLYPYPFMDAGTFNALTRKSVEGLDIGIGDDVFTVGRFISREGKKINIPALRFGNIAQMPVEPVRMENGFEQECFLVEVRSLSGSSGSPVFLYIPPQLSLKQYTEEAQSHIYRQSPLLRHKRRNMEIGLGPILLGVSFCYFHTYEKVRSKATGEPLHDWQVRSNSGMMGVIPGWKINDLIFGDTLMGIADKHGKELFKGSQSRGIALTSEEASPQSSDENPKHREDFNSLVGAAARKQPQGD